MELLIFRMWSWKITVCWSCKSVLKRKSTFRSFQPPLRQKEKAARKRREQCGIVMARGTTFCAILHLKEDNARFVLLVLILLLYMLIGAGIFHVIEGSTETRERLEYKEFFQDYKNKQDNATFNETEFMEVLERYARASAKGLLPGKRPRWDFPGAFYFVATVVSTIGKATMSFSL